MFRKPAVIVLALAAVAAAAFWIVTTPAVVAAGALGAHAADLNNGRAMFLAGGCSSCHATPNQKDRGRLGGGLALNSPFGVFHVPNISPDPKDGIGSWTEAQFVTAMTEGTSPEGEHLFPAFPYPSYRNMTVDDVRDLFGYLKTLPAVGGNAPGHELRFPFGIRRLVGLWKLFYLRGERWHPDPAHSATWNRGSYLVNGPGHCAECHSPRDALGGIIADKRFTGGPSPDGQGGVPNITQFKLKSWSVEDIASVLADGTTPDADRVGGSMLEVVRSTSQLSDDDRTAMAVYVKSLPPVAGVPTPAK